MPKFLTLEEATRVLPDVERIIRRLRRVRDQAVDLRGRVDELWGALEGEEVSLSQVGEAQHALEALQEEFGALVAELEQRGAILRDLDLGLVDFLSLAGRTEIYLCWRLGEPAIAFWHGLNQGYAGRKPLTVLSRLRPN